MFFTRSRQRSIFALLAPLGDEPRDEVGGRRGERQEDEREHDVDPDGVLPVEERLRRAEMARKAYFTRLALKSAQVRRQRCERSGKPRRPGVPYE